MHRGVTLVELMVAITILTIIMLVVVGITNHMSSLWKGTSSQIEAFQGARSAFDAMRRRLGQATLNTYYDYFDASGNSFSSPAFSGTPKRYGRQSELHFLSGPELITKQTPGTHAVFFQAPLGLTDAGSYEGLNNALNAAGFYVAYLNDEEAGSRPAFITEELAPHKYRFRLMQFTQPIQELEIYKTANVSGRGWYSAGASPAGRPSNTALLADNIIAMVILPKRARKEDPAGTTLSPDYVFDTRRVWEGGPQPAQMNQLPPLLHVLLVALDEPSAQRICTSPNPPDLGVEALFRNAADLEGDLEELKRDLAGKRLNYEIFRADIALRSAKWSE